MNSNFNNKYNSESYKNSDQLDKHDLTFKILTIGESGVGKTSIILRYTDNKFSSHHLLTIGIDFKTKLIDYLNKKIKLYLWDTAGQERFKNIAHQYFNGADGVFLVFDVTDKISFENVTGWIKQMLNYTSIEKTGMILLGNKIDAESKRVIQKEEAEELASQYGIKYFETSALSNYNLDEGFSCMIEEIFIKKGIDSKSDEKNDRITLERKSGESFAECKC